MTEAVLLIYGLLVVAVFLAADAARLAAERDRLAEDCEQWRRVALDLIDDRPLRECSSFKVK